MGHRRKTLFTGVIMGKTQNAVYKPGELGRVRSKLGDINDEEAKRMAKVLGGEVGVEKDADPKLADKGPGRVRRDSVILSIPGKKRKAPGRRVDVAGSEEKNFSGGFDPADPFSSDPGDDPAVQLKISYLERIKMDRFASQVEFEVKNSMQVLISILSFFGEPADNVNPRFINQRINIYYNKISQLVDSTKTLLPKNNTQRSERLKKTSPFAFAILNLIRSWEADRIGSEIVKLQSHSHSAKVSEFAEILRAVYKPLFLLKKLDVNKHIKEAYKLLYKLLYIENPMDNKEKNQDLIRTAITCYNDIKRDVQHGLYPILLKSVSDRWFPYEQFFQSRRNRFMAFIGASESDQLKPLDFNTDQTVNANLEKISNEINNEEPEEEKPQEDLEAAALKEREANEKRAFNQSINALEMLFPKAGWDKLTEFPDLYPYFVDVYGLRRGYELIAPDDPLQQVAVLMHIIEDLCVALSHVSFEATGKPDPANAGSSIQSTINNWRRYIDNSFSKEYLPRLSEYCRILEHNLESRTSVFAKRTLNELRWTKRLYFLPYYKFESLGPPPFQKQDVTVIYGETKAFRRILTMAAVGIERGKRSGGDEKKSRCDGINNPWEKYNFDIPNPVSRRLDALLPPEKRNNAAVIFFSLSAVILLDSILNDENSWAYRDDRSPAFFRSKNGEGVVPIFGVDHKIDADKLFKDSIRKREENK